MTVRAIAGLTAFNVLLCVVGTTLLVALRPRATTRDLLRLAGLSYLLGVSALAILLTLFIVVGIPVNLTTILVTILALACVALAVAPGRRDSLPPDTTEASRRRFLTMPSALVLALLIVALEAVFRKGRLQGLLEFDSWDSWGPKARALYEFGKLDPHFLDGLPGGSYPPGLPALLSAGLQAIGSPDLATLHLQYWFLGVGFIAAVVGLLATRVEPLLLLPFALLFFVMPDIRSRSVDMYGDLPLGFLIAAGAVLIALWLAEQRRWQLPAAALLLAGAVLMKREGVLLAGCVVLAGLVASGDRIRAAWPRLAAVFVVAFAAGVPWQIWLRVEDLPGNGPQGGLHFLTDPGRGWDAFVVVKDNLFNFDLWSLSMTVALAAVGLCLLARAWRMAAYLSTLVAASVLACTVILWSDSTLQLTDVNVVSRLVGTVALTVVAVTPLALQSAFGVREPGARERRGGPAWRSALVWSVLVAGAVVYPATLLAEGGARFPKASDCVADVSEGGDLMVVFGYADSYAAARRLRTRAVAAGVRSVQVSPDGCGRARVFVDHVPNRTAAAHVIGRSRSAGLQPHLEAHASG